MNDKIEWYTGFDNFRKCTLYGNRFDVELLENEFEPNRNIDVIIKENLEKLIPLTAKDYEKKYGNEELDAMKATAGVKIDTKAPKNDYTESLRRAAGLI